MVFFQTLKAIFKHVLKNLVPNIYDEQTDPYCDDIGDNFDDCDDEDDRKPEKHHDSLVKHYYLVGKGPNQMGTRPPPIRVMSI